MIIFDTAANFTWIKGGNEFNAITNTISFSGQRIPFAILNSANRTNLSKSSKQIKMIKIAEKHKKKSLLSV